MCMTSMRYPICCMARNSVCTVTAHRRVSRALIASKADKAKDFTNERVRNRSDEINEAKRSKNRNKSKIRARVEHVFAVHKRMWSSARCVIVS